MLAPEGLALLDLMNPARVRSTLVPSRARGAGVRLHERRRLERGGSRVVKREVSVRAPDGRERSWHEDVRLYEPQELAALLTRAGFALERTEGDFDGRPFDSGSARQIVWARYMRLVGTDPGCAGDSAP